MSSTLLRSAVSAAVLTVTLTGAAAAATPSQLANLNREIFPGAEIDQVVEIGDLAFFTLSTGELWRTDGTAAGTFRVPSGCPGEAPCGQPIRLVGQNRTTLFFTAPDVLPAPQLWATDGTVAGTRQLTSFDRTDALFVAGSFRFRFHWSPALGKLLFMARTTEHGHEPWVSDGTPAGTRLLADLAAGPASSSPYFDNGADAGGKVLFTAVDEAGDEPWVTDGTAAGTFRLRDVAPGTQGSIAARFVDLGEVILFTAEDPTRGVELWRTDGTPGGTVPVVDWTPGAAGTAFIAGLVAGDQVFYSVRTAPGAFDLVRSDGTAGGTRRLASFAVPENVLALRLGAVLGQRVVFTAIDPDHGIEPWVSDGTVAGTVPLGDLCPGSCSSEPRDFVVTGDQLYFSAEDGTAGRELWVTDGTPAGTRRAADLCAGPCASDPVPWRGTSHGLFFTADDGLTDRELWRLPAAGAPLRLTDLAGREALKLPLAVVEDRLLFIASDLSDGLAVWESDGSTAGTHAAATLQELSDQGSFPTGFTRVADELWFFAGDGDGRAIWRTGGTPESLRRGPIVAAAPGGGPFEVVAPTAAGARLFWLDTSGLTGTLLASDGTQAGTREVAAGVRGFGPAGTLLPAAGDRVYFWRLDEGARGLWASNGTPAGTVQVRPLEPGQGEAAVLGGRLLFPVRAEDEFGFRETLWVSDGTAGGTRQIAAFPDDVNVTLGEFEALGDRVLFTVSGTGTSLWSSDGTTAGTQPVLPGVLFGRIHSLTTAGDRAFFAAEGADGLSLWVTRGTAAGTEELARVEPNEGSLTAVGRDLYFVGFDRRVWRSDGTPAGTGPFSLVPLSDGPVELAAVAGRLAVTTGFRGEELWLSDGTPAGTERVGDFEQTGAGPVAFAGRMFFAADDGRTGLEPWTFPLPGTTPPPPPPPAGACSQPGAHTSTLCLLGERFRVEAHWRDARTGTSGQATAVPFGFSDDSGAFWFFTDNNLELVVKVLDARVVNDFHWVFYGALSHVEYWIVVTDTATGEQATYHNPQGRICGAGDVTAFPRAAGASSTSRKEATSVANPLTLPVVSQEAGATGTCEPGPDHLCLTGNRYRVEVAWHDRRSGGTGVGHAIPGTGDSGFFWFFDDENVELVVKVLDARVVNGHVWVFFGALTHVEYTLSVTDTVTGLRREYFNPQGNICGQADVAAF